MICFEIDIFRCRASHKMMNVATAGCIHSNHIFFDIPAYVCVLYMQWLEKSFVVSFIKDFYIDWKVVHSVKHLTAQHELRLISVVWVFIGRQTSRLIALIRDENPLQSTI